VQASGEWSQGTGFALNSPLPENGSFSVKSMQNKHDETVATTSPDGGILGQGSLR
jgi:hypothetical protein